MNDFDRLNQKVVETPTVNESASRLLTNIAERIRVAAGNTNASNSLADMIDRENERLVQGLLANTPVIEATPPVHPEPEDRPSSSGDRSGFQDNDRRDEDADRV